MNDAELSFQISVLFSNCENLLVQKFFDVDSNKDLEKKIDILTRINNGEFVSEDELIEILENYPKDDVIWD